MRTEARVILRDTDTRRFIIGGGIIHTDTIPIANSIPRPSVGSIACGVCGGHILRNFTTSHSDDSIRLFIEDLTKWLARDQHTETDKG